MGIGTKRAQAISIVNSTIAENPAATANEIIAKIHEAMYSDKADNKSATACYRLTLAEQPDLVKGAPAIVKTPKAVAAPVATKEDEVPAAATETIESITAELSAELAGLAEMDSNDQPTVVAGDEHRV